MYLLFINYPGLLVSYSSSLLDILVSQLSALAIPVCPFLYQKHPVTAYPSQYSHIPLSAPVTAYPSQYPHIPLSAPVTAYPSQYPYIPQSAPIHCNLLSIPAFFYPPLSTTISFLSLPSSIRPYPLPSPFYPCLPLFATIHYNLLSIPASEFHLYSLSNVMPYLSLFS